jgi:hypothetical protein
MNTRSLTEFRSQNSGFRIQESGVRSQNSGFSILNSGFCVLNSVFWILNTVFCLLAFPAHADLFAGSDTYVVSNAASAVIVVSNAPASGGAALAWYPAGILANFRDSPDGAVLIVSHVRGSIVNRHVNTNAGGTISVTNVLYTSGTGTTDALIWDPTNRYTLATTNDTLRIETSSTNAEIILNKAVQR